MAWEWSGTGQRWTLTIGTWYAAVYRFGDSHYVWYAYIERMTAPHERHHGPTCKAAVDGRAWCEAEIARRQAPGP